MFYINDSIKYLHAPSQLLSVKQPQSNITIYTSKAYII